MGDKEEIAPPNSPFYLALGYFKGHVTTIITLATGSLVLSVTFIKDINLTTLRYLALLQVGWILFALSIIAGVFYSYVLTFLARDPENIKGLNKIFKKMLSKTSIVLHFAFIFGIVCFLIFALANVNIKKAEPHNSSSTTTATPSR